MKHVKEGIEFVIPIETLRMLTWEEIETRACGAKIISVESLKSITEYEGGSETSEYFQRFWRVFEELTEEDKQKYLKFVWGRSRLPADLTNLRNKHSIHLIPSWGDNMMPQAHTCFFMLDLPNYTTDEACEKKLVYAITSCGEIDTDGSAYGISDEEDED